VEEETPDEVEVGKEEDAEEDEETQAQGRRVTFEKIRWQFALSVIAHKSCRENIHRPRIGEKPARKKCWPEDKTPGQRACIQGGHLFYFSPFWL
jgi:hypothetical protein